MIHVQDRELWYVLVPPTFRLDILADCCEYDNEHLGFIKGGDFFWGGGGRGSVLFF